MDIAGFLSNLSGMTSAVIVIAAGCHLILFSLLWRWHRRAWSNLASCLDESTRELRHRSVLDPAASLPRQVDAFIHDIRDLLAHRNRQAERAACRNRLNILDERRAYLDSLSFETVSNAARVMIEAYPLAGVLGTILAIGAALQSDPPAGDASAPLMMAHIVSRFGEAIWSTFFGLFAAILLMFVNSLVETRFERISDTRQQLRELVGHAKRELEMTAGNQAADDTRSDP